MKPSIELLRLIAVILITFTHTRNEFERGIYYFIIEYLPTYGTAVLSIISGYLYFSISSKKANLFSRKIKTLFVPFLIANLSVVLIVLAIYFLTGYNPLNRLSYDLTILTEGVLSLSSPPINPPTYFIRDIFIIFAILSLFTQRTYKTLFVLLPVAFFGILILRLDVALLFILGVIYAKYKNSFDKKIWISITVLITLLTGFIFPLYLKFFISFLIFISTLDLKFKLLKTARYSYLLHLYHSPIIVITYPIINTYVSNPIVNVAVQITTALVAVYMLFLITKKWNSLQILSGGR